MCLKQEQSMKIENSESKPTKIVWLKFTLNISNMITTLNCQNVVLLILVCMYRIFGNCNYNKRS